MISSVTDSVSIGTSKSFPSFGRHGIKPCQHDTCSQPFGKPNLCCQKADHKRCAQGEKLYKGLKTFLQRTLHISTRSKSHKVETLEESKAIIRELAAQLGRVSQCGENLQSSSVDDSYSLAECRLFILQWAKELDSLPQVSGPVELCESWEQYEEVEKTHPEQADRRLKTAQKLLSIWASELEERPQGSVCAAEDVRSVLEDLGRRWKRGQLPNMLPALDFIMWSVLQDKPLKGGIPYLWLKSKQRFRSQGAVDHIPDIVWNMFTESYVNIVLDQNTAHPDFVFSPDRRQVRVRQFGERQGASRSRDRFDGWWCVLGTEGFSSGRAYWEVGVVGKEDWRLGVVRGSAPKNGFIDLNTRSGYWTLRLQRDSLRALSVPAKDLPLSQPLSTVGVYLDMEEGQLSFYDAERRRHIYTFNHSFKEEVFPIVGTIEIDTDLIILPQPNP
ncbi:hypothetical protein AALO_G00036270 [Alosa alosa]|uniref:B30.2/SPRY domain-containing protein n=1 Tax=Alosa alosa TaxID=278164 RepID=A0AAV6H760_9TELE|nr:E3 ubiquitin-protein ligase TRIM69-like isoform X1 [Alosa alosa]KAG5282929.1 hypothetical protein AALO_G00036270 [Alosa alosa]